MVASSRVYIGNLGPYGKKEELEQEFSKCGSIKDIWIARNPPGFAFIIYNDPRDAEAAVSLMDGKRVCGVRVKVELSHQGDERAYQRRGQPAARRGPPPRGSPPPRGPSRGSPRGPPLRSRGPERPERSYGYPEDRERRPPAVDRDRFADRLPPSRYDSGYDNYRSSSYGRDRAPPLSSSYDRYSDRYGDRYDDRYPPQSNGIDRYRDSYPERGERYGDRMPERGGGSFGGRRSEIDSSYGSSRLPPPRSPPPRRARSPPPRSWGPGRSRSPLRR